MKSQLESNETIVKEGVATLSRGLEGVGGYLYLTNRRLIFEPHPINIQKDIEIIDVSNIHSVSLSWSRLLNLVPLVPNAINVVTKNDQRFRIIVYGRRVWAVAIASVSSQVPA
jgi:hypothetical protein